MGGSLPLLRFNPKWNSFCSSVDGSSVEGKTKEQRPLSDCFVCQRPKKPKKKETKEDDDDEEAEASFCFFVYF